MKEQGRIGKEKTGQDMRGQMKKQDELYNWIYYVSHYVRAFRPRNGGQGTGVGGRGFYEWGQGGDDGDEEIRRISYIM